MERVAWSLSRYESQPQTTDSQGVDLLSRAADLLALGQASLRWELDKKTGVFDDARRAAGAGGRKAAPNRPDSPRAQGGSWPSPSSTWKPKNGTKHGGALTRRYSCRSTRD